MCWAHMIRCVDKRLKSIPAKMRNEIRSDIEFLQLSSSETISTKGFDLFKTKWQNKSVAIDNLFDYFIEQWISQCPGWYEGFAPGIPSTNNALESTNRQIKESGTFREKRDLAHFVSIVENTIVRNWSIERDISTVNSKPFHLEPKVIIRNFTAAYNWLEKRKDVVKIRVNATERLYYIPAGSSKTTLSRNEVDSFIDKHVNCNWVSFEQSKKDESSIYCVRLNRDSWLSGECTCPFFQKKLIVQASCGIIGSFQTFDDTDGSKTSDSRRKA